jgi:hypothetical protein
VAERKTDAAVLSEPARRLEPEPWELVAGITPATLDAAERARAWQEAVDGVKQAYRVLQRLALASKPDSVDGLRSHSMLRALHAMICADQSPDKECTVQNGATALRELNAMARRYGSPIGPFGQSPSAEVRGEFGDFVIADPLALVGRPNAILFFLNKLHEHGSSGTLTKGIFESVMLDAMELLRDPILVGKVALPLNDEANEASGQLARAFKQWDENSCGNWSERDYEKLFRAGLRALGVTGSASESLLDFLKKRETRDGLRRKPRDKK